MSDSPVRVPEPNARVTDYEPSHLAARIASRSAAEVERAVLLTFANAAGDEGLIDEQVEEFYADNWAFQGWPFVVPGTPRKRRSDLTKAGLLRKAPGPGRKNSNNITVTVFEITKAGRDTLEQVQS